MGAKICDGRREDRSCEEGAEDSGEDGMAGTISKSNSRFSSGTFLGAIANWEREEMKGERKLSQSSAQIPPNTITTPTIANKGRSANINIEKVSA